MKQLFLILCLVLSIGAVAVTEAELQERFKKLPKAERSADGRIEVFAVDQSEDEVSYRHSILSFAARIITTLETKYRLFPERRSSPLITIYAQANTNSDTRVIIQKDKDLTRITLPSPGHSDLDELELQLSAAYFYAFTSTNEIPLWAAQGALRMADNFTSRADRFAILHLWTQGRLPYFPALCTDMRVAYGRAACLPSFIIGWMNETGIFKQELERLRAGGTWDGNRIARNLTETSEPVLQDGAADNYLLRMRRRVIAPGETSQWDADLFASHLNIYLPYKFNYFRMCDLFGAVRTNEAVVAAIKQKVVELPFCAIGKDERLRASAAAYVNFLNAVINPKITDKELETLLQSAEETLRP